jgi:uncharacterized protein (DUF2062 family)
MEVEGGLSGKVSDAASGGWFARWRTRARAEAKKVLSEHGSAGKLGLAVGVGVFCGCSPFHGFQFLLTLGLAWGLRLNKVAALVGLQISAPPLTPFIIFAGLQAGALLLHGALLPVSLSGLEAAVGASMTRTLVVDFVVGSLALGVLLGVLFGLLTATWVSRRRAAQARAANPG